MRVKVEPQFMGNDMGGADQINPPKIAANGLQGHERQIKSSRPIPTVNIFQGDRIDAHFHDEGQRNVDDVHEDKRYQPARIEAPVRG